MNENLKAGDIVCSLSGRDVGKYFLIIKLEGKNAYIADGRTRKITACKRKNVKHLKKVRFAELNSYAIRIQNGEAVGNEKLYRSLKAETQKIQED